MPDNTDPILIDRLDNNLSQADAAKVDTEIATDKSTATEWAFLKLAVETIRLGAIRDKVAAGRSASKIEAPVVKMERKEGAVVRSLFSRNLLRIAIAAVLVLGVTAVYKYSTVSAVSIYNSNFSAYELGTVRGNETGDKLEAAYRARDWSGVLSAFEGQAVKSNKSHFLAGMARLELKQYPGAVTHFETVLANNSKNGEKYFQPESEYYLALAYLMNNQNAKGIELIRKIRSDVYHPYYPLASKIPVTDLKIVEMKR